MPFEVYIFFLIYIDKYIFVHWPVTKSSISFSHGLRMSKITWASLVTVMIHTYSPLLSWRVHLYSVVHLLLWWKPKSKRYSRRTSLERKSQNGVGQELQFHYVKTLQCCCPSRTADSLEWCRDDNIQELGSRLFSNWSSSCWTAEDLLEPRLELGGNEVHNLNPLTP